MIQIVNILARHIAAAFEFQATSDSRYMLNGILIERAHMVATDGHKMLVANLGDDLERTHAVESDHIVSLDPKFATECRKLKNRDAHATLAFDLDSGEHYAWIEGGARFPFTIIDGQFPSWRTVIESPCNENRTPEAFTMGARLLESVAKAAKVLAPSNHVNHGAFFAPREMESTLVRFLHAPEVFAVLMPLRGDGDYHENDKLPYTPKA